MSKGVHGRQSLLWSVNPSGAPCSAGTDQGAADTWMTATLCACNSHCGTEHLATSMSVSCMPAALGTENAVLQCFLAVSRCVSVCLCVYVRAKCCGQVAADAFFRAPDPGGRLCIDLSQETFRPWWIFGLAQCRCKCVRPQSLLWDLNP